MIRSLFSGVSGMKSHQIRMDVVGNNIANVNTSGYKAGRANFQDTLYQFIKNASLTTNPAQAGLGITVAGINTNMAQGGLQSTGRNLDLAINGSGFFKVTDGVKEFFTRNGIFYIAQDGSIVNSSGYKLFGQISETARAESAQPIADVISSLQPVTQASPLNTNVPVGLNGSIIFGLGTNNDNLPSTTVHLFVDKDGGVHVNTDGETTWSTATVSGSDLTFDLNGDTITLAGWGPGGSNDITGNVGSHIQFDIADGDPNLGSVATQVSNLAYAPNSGSLDTSTAVSNISGLSDGDSFTINVIKQPDGSVYYSVNGGNWTELTGGTVTLDTGKTLDLDTSTMNIGDAFTFDVTATLNQTAGSSSELNSGAPAGLNESDISGLGTNNDNLPSTTVHLFVDKDGGVHVSTDGGNTWSTATVSGSDLTFDLNGDTITLAGWGSSGSKDITGNVGWHIQFDIRDADPNPGTVTKDVTNLAYAPNSGSLDTSTAVSNISGLSDGDSFTINVIKQPDGSVYYSVNGGNWTELTGGTVTLDTGKTLNLDTSTMNIGDAFTFDVTATLNQTAGSSSELNSGVLNYNDITIYGLTVDNNDNLSYTVHLFVDKDRGVHVSTDGGNTWSTADVSGSDLTFDLNGDTITLAGWGPGGINDITGNVGSHIQFDIADVDPNLGFVATQVSNLAYAGNSGSLDTSTAVSNISGLSDGDSFTINVIKQPDGSVYYSVNGGNWTELTGGTVTLDTGKTLDLDTSTMNIGDAFTFDVKGIVLTIRGTRGDGSPGMEKSILINPSETNLDGLINKINLFTNQTGVAASESEGKLVLSTVDKTENATMSISGSVATLLGIPTSGSFTAPREMSEPQELKLNLPPGTSLNNLTVLPDGRIYGQDSNGNSLKWSSDGKDVAQLLLFNFPNQDGLQRTAQNLFQESTSSGQAIKGTPGEPGYGTIESGYLEMSNVDLTDEFSNMITTQRGYQANARVITVSDAMLEELINLKR